MSFDRLGKSNTEEKLPQPSATPSSWVQLDRLETQKILELFWKQCIKNNNSNMVDGFKKHIISSLFKNAPQEQERVEKIFKEAPQSFDKFCRSIQNFPSHLIYDLNRAGKFIPTNERRDRARTIDSVDIENLREYLLEDKISAAISLRANAGNLVTPDIPENQSSTIFAMHSVGKLFTGMLAMLMIRDGVILEADLNKPIQLDEGIKQSLPPSVRKQLEMSTLHQAMTHKAGLGDYFGGYIDSISRGKIPEMKQPEDFLPYCQDSYYVKATAATPDDSETKPCGYFLVRNKDDWDLIYLNERNEKKLVNIDEINGLRGALKSLPDKKPSELSADDLSRVHQLLVNHYMDNQKGEYRYSNVGILLVGLAIKHAYEKDHGPCDYNSILKKYIQDPAGLSSFSVQPPKDEKFNDNDPIAAHFVGSPAGGYWITVKDLAEFGKWIYEQCVKDPKLVELMEAYGQEFYPHPQRVEHGGYTPSSSAFLSVSLETGAVVAILANHTNIGGSHVANYLRDKIQEKICSEECPSPRNRVINYPRGDQNNIRTPTNNMDRPETSADEALNDKYSRPSPPRFSSGS